MGRHPAWLLDYRKNKYSQSGEDGIIREILQTLPASDKWCVEFGAWDGVHLSNTRNLIESADYSAVLIEGNKTKFSELKLNCSSNNNVIALNTLVGFNSTDNLDSILARTPIPDDFDFLCIDVDGTDYHIWEATIKYRPKLVCIEFNPTIPTEVRFVQRADNSVRQGASLLSLYELGKKKNYELVSVLHCNAIFVDAKFYPLLEIADNGPATLREDLSAITYLFSGYDGRVILDGYRKLPWHGLPLSESAIQPLPRFLQEYPDNYSRVQRLLFGVFAEFMSIRKSLTTIYRRLTGHIT